MGRGEAGELAGHRFARVQALHRNNPAHSSSLAPLPWALT